MTTRTQKKAKITVGVAALCLTASVFAINGLAEPHERQTGELREKAQAYLARCAAATRPERLTSIGCGPHGPR